MDQINETEYSTHHPSNDSAARSDSTDNSPVQSLVYVFPVTAFHWYLWTTLKGKRAIIIDRSGQFCTPHFKSVTYFWRIFYYHFLQYLFLPFIRLGIPIRDEIHSTQRHLHRMKEIYQEGRAESLRWYHLLWRLVRKGTVFTYYRVVILWRITRELMMIVGYLCLVFPIVLISLGIVYVYLLVIQRLKSLVLSSFLFC